MREEKKKTKKKKLSGNFPQVLQLELLTNIDGDHFWIRHSVIFHQIKSKTFVWFFFRTPSWRGAMIEADQNTEPPPSDGDKVAAPVPVYPANPAPPEGQC